MRLARILSCLVSSLAFLVSTASGAQLLLDGQTAVTKTLGETLSINLVGATGKPAFLLADVASGPTSIYGQSVPIAFSSVVTVIPLGIVPGAGRILVNTTLPNDPSLDGTTVYLAGAVFVGPAVSNVDFSNGAVLTFSAQPVIHATQATMVGRKVILDAAAYANPDGSAKLGHSVNWSIVSAPVGSTATIVDANRPYARLVPDRGGDYVVKATIVTPSFTSQQTGVVHAWQVTSSPLSDGGISIFPTFSLTGVVGGSAVQSVTLDGAPLSLAGNGSYGPIGVSITDGVKTNRTFRITHPDGTATQHRVTFFQGFPQLLAGASTKSLVAQVQQPAFDQIEVLGETELKAANFKNILLALPPQQVSNEEGPFGITIFSATIDFTNLVHNPNIDLQLTPTPGGIVAVVTIYDIRADFNVWGEILEIDYDLSGYMTTNPTTITATLVGSAQNGQLAIGVQNVVVNRANFDFELNGFFGSVAELFVIESSVKAQVESTIASTVASELPAAMAEILNAFSLSGSLQSVLDVDLNLAAPITGVVHSAFGVAIQLDGKTTVGVKEPTSPVINAFRASPAPPVAFASTTPTGQSYGAALGVADDFINQVLASATAAGLLDGDLTSLFPSEGGAPVVLATDQLAILFPQCGFENFPVGTPITLRAHGTVPPVIVFTPGGPKMARVYMENIEVEFEVALPYSATSIAPLLLVSMRGSADVDLTQALDGTLNATIGTTTLGVDLLRTYPGADFTAIETQTQFLGVVFDFALPQIIEAIGSIPLPSLETAGLSLAPTQIHLVGTPQQNLGLYGNLVVVPAGP